MVSVCRALELFRFCAPFAADFENLCPTAEVTAADPVPVGRATDGADDERVDPKSRLNPNRLAVGPSVVSICWEVYPANRAIATATSAARSAIGMEDGFLWLCWALSATESGGIGCWWKRGEPVADVALHSLRVYRQRLYPQMKLSENPDEIYIHRLERIGCGW